jgi:hypothetical protein
MKAAVRPFFQPPPLVPRSGLASRSVGIILEALVYFLFLAKFRLVAWSSQFVQSMQVMRVFVAPLSASCGSVIRAWVSVEHLV